MATTAAGTMVQTGQRFGGLRVAARRAGVSLNTVKRWITSGRLPAYQPTPKGKVLVNLDELDEMIRSSGREVARVP